MSDMGMFQSQSMRQEQIITQNQIQSLEILMAPLQELQQKIDEELSSNPVLEESGIIEDFDDDFDSSSPLQEVGEAKAENVKDDDFDEINQLTNAWETLLPLSSFSSNYEVDEEKRSHFFDSLVQSQTLEEDLNEQLLMLNLSNKESELAKLITGSIDGQGYFRGSLDELSILGGVDTFEMERILNLVQTLEPAGIAARDLKESLLIQLERRGESTELLQSLINNYLDDIGNNRIPQVAKKLNITIDELKLLLSKIKEFKPYPCLGYTSNIDTMFVVPEIIIEKSKHGYDVISKNEYIPRLRISDKYLSYLSNPDIPKETKDYIKQKVTAGTAIIRSIEQRQETIKKIAEVIVDTQYDFFENGSEFLKPLTMKEVADKIGVHETTVSRAVSKKYAITPQGVLELRYFFNSGYVAEDGELVSNKGVMEKIKEIISSEDKFKPYSDDHISDILKNGGIPVARRTVAKYREALNIPSSRLRREYR